MWINLYNPLDFIDFAMAPAGIDALSSSGGTDVTFSASADADVGVSTSSDADVYYWASEKCIGQRWQIHPVTFDGFLCHIWKNHSNFLDSLNFCLSNIIKTISISFCLQPYISASAPFWVRMLM